MKTEKITISKYSKNFIKSLIVFDFNFVIENDYLISFEIPKNEWIKLFQETIKKGNNPFELYSWSSNIIF